MSGENIAVIVLDTLRKDSFDEHFGWLKETATIYDNAWSTTHWTVPAHASLFTGRYSREIGTHGKSRHLNYSGDTLAETLSAAGYRTRAMVANLSIGSAFNFDRGFDEYIELFSTQDWGQHVDPEKPAFQRYLNFVKNVVASDDNTIDALQSALNHKIDTKRYDDDGAAKIHDSLHQMNFSDKEFLFLNLMEAHTPYHPPEEYLTGPPVDSLSSFEASVLDGPEQDPDVIRRGYDDAVRYLSEKYQEIHSTLLDSFDYVVTLADHGEALGENGNWCHVCGLGPEVTQIPLAISGRTHEFDSSTRPVSLLDVYQTVCSLANVEPASETGGCSLDAEVISRPRFVETHGLLDTIEEYMDGEKYPPEISELYDIPRFGVATKSGYAYERHGGDLVVSGQVDSPEELIHRFDDEYPVAAIEDDSELDGDTKQQLKHLGYA